MISDRAAFVWIWLPGAVEPVVAGKLTHTSAGHVFHYGKSYLERENAIALDAEELPLTPGVLPLRPGLAMPGAISDAAPDAWGRRVLINRLLGRAVQDRDPAELDELTYLLESGSDRTGALDFQISATDYVPRESVGAGLDELMASADRVERGVPLRPELDRALFHGSSIGGARPKASIEDGDKKYIAKFGAGADLYGVVKAEYVAMCLAARCGLSIAEVRLTTASGRDVLLIERFDRVHSAFGWRRRGMLSALTLLGLDEMMARYASYEDFAELVRHRFCNAKATLAELFARLTFSVLCGNTDDHARNHAAFWDGRVLSLTPAYDICPQSRSGNEASQAMAIAGGDRRSRIASCISAARHFLLSPAECRSIVERQLTVIGECWSEVCAEAHLNETDRRLLRTRQFLNPYAFEDLAAAEVPLRRLADEVRSKLK